MDEPWTPQPEDRVTITSGPFEEWDGIIESVNQEIGKVKVKIAFFGRDTVVELNVSQVGKLP